MQRWSSTQTPWLLCDEVLHFSVENPLSLLSQANHAKFKLVLATKSKPETCLHERFATSNLFALQPNFHQGRNYFLTYKKTNAEKTITDRN
jgi:hypothetical protein